MLQELDSELHRHGLAASLAAQMERSIAAALQAAASAPAGFAPLPQCFELFGADFVVEDGEEPKAWLLEVNAGPDLAVFGQRLRSRSQELVRDVLAVAVVPFLDVQPPESFESERTCKCSRAADGTGFNAPVWFAAPRTQSATKELAAFKRRFSIAGQWAKALHEGSSIAVRGVQGVAGSQSPDRGSNTAD